MKITPAPGILIAHELQDKDDSAIRLTQKVDSRLVHGVVIAVGPDLVTDFGTTLLSKNYAHVGDEVYFLSYEGNYDNSTIDGVKYYMVKWQDLRAVLK